MCNQHDGSMLGILQIVIPKGLGIAQIIALVNALAKLHNFCIGKDNSGSKIIMQQLS